MNYLDEVIEEVRSTRVVKVFLSSTFRDMHLERDKLLTDAFVRLREECSERGITWNEVDLRWGVTQEQVDNFEVLPVCFSEIENSLPFFVGILGERYGWVPDEDSEPEQLVAIKQKYQWLNDYEKRSVTELEFLHGAILNQNPHALFYIRNKKDLALLSEEEKEDYFENEPWRKEKLNNLKSQIMDGFQEQAKTFDTVEQLNELVYKQMKQKIDEFFPQDELQNSYELEQTKHLHFSKVKSSFFIGRGEYTEKLNEYILANHESPLCIHGPSGVGKSTLIANWYQSSMQLMKQQGFESFVHFIGATPDSNNPVWIGKQIIYTINKKFGIELAEPNNYNELNSILTAAFEIVAKKGKLAIIVDSIDQLILQNETYGSMPEWLPSKLPQNIKLIVTTTTDSAAKTYFEQKSWMELELKAFEEEEYKLFIENYLKFKYSKNLDSLTYEAIISHPLVNNPLFLVTLLEEIRIYGKPDILEYTKGFLTVQTIEELFIKRLERLEAIYKQTPLYKGDNLVKDALSLLWVSNNGLTEMELREILGGQEILKNVIWSKFYYSMGTNLVSNGGLICLFHSYLRNAVAQKYGLEQNVNQRQYRKKIARYFLKKKEKNKDLLRVSKEYPHQLFALENWKALQEVMVDYALLKELWYEKSEMVRLYWRYIEMYTDPKHTQGNIHLTRLAAYQKLLQNPADFDLAYVEIVMQLLQLDHPTESYNLLTYLLEQYEGLDDYRKTLELLAIKSEQITIIASIDEAYDYYTQLHALATKYNEPFYKQLSLEKLARYHLSKLDFEQALTYINEHQSICEENNLMFGIQKNYKLRSILALKQGDHKQAELYLKEAYDICTVLNMSYELQEYWGIKYSLSLYLQDYEQAKIDCLNRQAICKRYGYTNELISCYLNQVQIITGNKKTKFVNNNEITTLFANAQSEAIKINNSYRQQEITFSRIKNYKYLKRLDLAAQELEEYLEIAKNRNNSREIASGLSQQINIYKELKQYKEAIAACGEHQRFCKANNLEVYSFFSLKEHVEILVEIGDIVQAEKQLHQCIEMLPIIRDNKIITRVWKLASDIAKHFGRIEDAKKYLSEMKNVAEAYNIHEKASQAIYETTLIYLNEGMKLYQKGLEAEAKKQFEIASEHINQPIKFSYRNESNEINNTRVKCEALLQGNYEAFNNNFWELHELSEDEEIVLQAIASLGTIVKKELNDEVIPKRPDLSKDDITEINKKLKRKKLIRYTEKAGKKKWIAITEFGSYRLQQLTGKVYEVPDLEAFEPTMRTWSNFQDSLQEYITAYDNARIIEDGTILEMPIQGNLQRVIVLFEDLSDFEAALEREIALNNRVVILMPNKQGIRKNSYNNKIIKFYRWLKEKYGDISNVPRKFEFYMIFEYQLKHKLDITLRPFKFY